MYVSSFADFISYSLSTTLVLVYLVVFKDSFNSHRDTATSLLKVNKIKHCSMDNITLEALKYYSGFKTSPEKRCLSLNSMLSHIKIRAS
jgi:hypothetical protein